MPLVGAESEFYAAVRLIATTPGYETVAEKLEKLAATGRVHFNSELEDRAHAHLTGQITIGPEASYASTLSLAETLVHEVYHLSQNPLEKTVSFWSGVVQSQDPMRRYEAPAYQAALDFLAAVASSQPELRNEAEQEAAAVRSSYEANYGTSL